MGPGGEDVVAGRHGDGRRKQLDQQEQEEEELGQRFRIRRLLVRRLLLGLRLGYGSGSSVGDGLAG